MRYPTLEYQSDRVANDTQRRSQRPLPLTQVTPYLLEPPQRR
jgi:hypothetical protein